MFLFLPFHWSHCPALLSPEGMELKNENRSQMSLLESAHYAAWEVACPLVKAIGSEAMGSTLTSV